MKNHLRGHAARSFVAALAALAGCHASSSGSSSGGAQPVSSGEKVTSADNGGGTDPSGGGGGGAGKHHPGKDNDPAVAPAQPTPQLVINKPTPEPMAPPPLAKQLAIPSLPNLPHPTKYPKPPAVPKGPDVVEECGQAWTGTDWVETECLDPEAHKKEARAAQVVIPYDKMKTPIESLPKMVDHRADGTEGPIRKQGGPQCTAFAFTAALDHAYARWTGQPGNFSVMQVWARYHKKNETRAADNNVGDTLANETDWPYDSKIANSWMSCPKDPSKKKADQECGKPADGEKLKSLEKNAVAEITQIEVIPAGQFEVLREKLAAGQDVAMAIHLQSFATAGDPGAKYMVGMKKDPDAKFKGGHQILLAGYADTPNGYYYLVHNSWGPKWGDAGYAWIHEELIKAYWFDKIMVIPDLQPMQVAERRARAHGKLIVSCEKDKLPDSISGECAGKCPDGSPRHNNVCADDKQLCPGGTVNLTGECVLAAPKSSGTDEKSHVKWECGPGGCSYEIPRDKLDCKEKECAVSCPAPTFRLATMQKGLACVE
jgi:Papain family cysteine protease